VRSITNIGGELTSKGKVKTVPDSQFSAIVRFDVFEIDLQAGELRKEGRKIKVQEQPFRVLSLLLHRAGQVVTREELRDKLWPADTFVDFDHGLNSAVARLREALRDSADKPRFIETIAKRGYRFIAPLEAGDQPDANSSAEAGDPNHNHIDSWNLARLRLLASLGLAVICGSVAAFVYPKTPAPLQDKIEVVPLTGLHGFQATPAFSPDGTLVAFRQSDGVSKAGIYTAAVGGEKTIQLTSDMGDCCPTWSPDGRQIAFSRYSDGVLSILTVPALGGMEHRLYRGKASMGGGLSWSPDGNYVAFVASPSGDRTRSTISFLSLADYSTYEITTPPPGYLDRSPMFSPDGKRLAFIRSTIAGVSNDIYVMSTSGGDPKRLTFDRRPIMGSPAWTADGREIVFSSDRGVAIGLWRVSAAGCVPVPVAGPVGEAVWPSIPTNGKHNLVYEQGVFKSNIWRLDLRDPTHHDRSPLPIVSEKGDKMRPELSPDGKKVAFESNRLGFWDLWTCEIEKGDCNQITSLHGTAGRARWSPDGRYIAFEFHPSEHSEIYIVEVAGGVPNLVPTIPGADNLSPSWSRDGKWLYFASKTGTEAFQIWKTPVQGGAPAQVTRHGGISAVESSDGRYLYYSKFEEGGVWRMPVQGHEEAQLLDMGGDGWPNWALSSEGIYFLKWSKSSHPTIQFLSFATGKTHPVWTLEREPGWGIGISSNGKSIVFTQDDFAESNLMMVENFR
jgi:Tol biopolymer transport system component/DNA-binding winged helix-turn-helix (wHTH) protein